MTNDDEGAALDRRAVDYLVQHFENMAKTDPVGTISVLRERLRVWTTSYEALTERDAAARSGNDQAAECLMNTRLGCALGATAYLSDQSSISHRYRR